MGNFARKIIDAIQHSMLDELFLKLVPLLFIANAWERLSPSDSGTVSLVLLLAVAGLWLFVWALGAIADRPQRTRRRTPYDTLHEHPPSGLAAWDQKPQNALRPPRLIRSLVMTFGAGGRSWITVIEGLAAVGALILIWLLGYKSPAFWSDIYFGLAEQASRERLFIAAAAALIVFGIRGWAVQQRERLAPSKARLPVVGSILIGCAFAVMLGMLASDLLGFGLLPGIVGGLAVKAFAFLPPWRDRVLEVLFGKREPTQARH